MIPNVFRKKDDEGDMLIQQTEQSTYTVEP